MIRERWVESTCLASVRPDRLDPDADHVALLRQHLRRGLVESGGVGTVLVDVEERIGSDPLAPVGTHQDPRAGGDPAVLCLPTFDPVRREEEVRVRGGLGTTVENAGRCDQLARWNGLCGVVRVVLARHPMDRRVEVGARVLTEGECVPVPSRAGVVVATDDVDAQTGGLAEDVRKADDGRVGTERLREIDDSDRAIREASGELLENGHVSAPRGARRKGCQCRGGMKVGQAS